MFSRKKSYLGIDIGAAGIKMVELRKQQKRPVLYTYGMVFDKHDVHSLTEHQTLDLNAGLDTAGSLATHKPIKAYQKIDETKVDEFAHKIKVLCKASRVKSKTAVVSLPVSSVFHAVVTLPATKDPEQMRKLIRSEVKKFIPFPLEELALDYQILDQPDKTKQKTQRALVNAVPNSLINFYTRVFNAAGLNLDALEPESTALTRSLVGREKAVTMLVDIGAERTNFFIIDQSIPITHQSIEFGGYKIDKILENILGVSADSAEQIKTDLFNNSYGQNGLNRLSPQQIMEIFMPVVDPIIKKIDLSFELYLRQADNADKKPEKVVLTGGSSLLPFLSQYITEKFSLKCYVGDPWSRVIYQQDLKPVLQEIGPRMSVAIGLALRNVL